VPTGGGRGSADPRLETMVPHVLSGRVLPLALVAGAVAGAATAPRAGSDGRIQLEFAGVLPMPEGSGSILVLREKGADTILPLMIPGDAAAQRNRKGGGGLLGRAIEALGGRVSEVEIERADDTRAGARVRLVQGARTVEVRARPSESVALAIAAGAPIVTSRRVLDESGLTPEDLARAHRTGGLAGRDVRM
jgi:bifunctional DNase/RNase